MSENIIEKEITVSGEFDISSTLTLPNNNLNIHPVIIIVPGTGNSDRDGNNKKLNMNLYKLVAEYLTSIGYATIRYDKRGLHKSDGDFVKTGLNDSINDIVYVYNYLKNRDDIDIENIFLLGHSEGAILSTIASDQMKLKGLILLAGAGVSIKSALSMQNQEAYKEIQNIKGLKGILLRLLYSENKIKKTQEKLYKKALATDEDVIRFQMRKFPAKWLREHLQYTDEDILKLLEIKKTPVLCLTGDKDVQADPDDLKSVDELNNDSIKTKVVENMDHVLRYYGGEKTIINLINQYKEEVDKPLHEELKNLLEKWLKEIK